MSIHESSTGAVPEVTMGWRIQLSLDHAGITTDAIAERLDVSRSTISRWCNDHGGPRKVDSMRRITLTALLALAFLVVGAPSCQPTEPAMTITAKVYNPGGSPQTYYTTCGYDYTVRGVVTPATATPKVTLQQRAGGKWVDAKLYADVDAYYGRSTTVRTATVNQSTGAYTIKLFTHWLSETRSLRVRSNGSTAVSPTLYVEVGAYDGC